MVLGFWRRRRPQKITEEKLPKRSVNDVLRNKFSEYDEKAEEAREFVYGDGTKGSLKTLQNYPGNKIGSSYYDRPSEEVYEKKFHKQGHKYTPIGEDDGVYESGSLYYNKKLSKDIEPGKKKLHGLGQRVTKEGKTITTERGEFEKGILHDGVKEYGTTTEYYKRGEKIGTMKNGRIVNGGFDAQQEQDLQTTLDQAKAKEANPETPIKFEKVPAQNRLRYDTEGNVQIRGEVKNGKLDGYGSLIQKGEKEGDEPIGDGVKKGIYTGLFKNGKLQPGGQVTRPGPDGNITSILAEDGSLIPVGDENTFDALPTFASSDKNATSTVFDVIEKTANMY